MKEMHYETHLNVKWADNVGEQEKGIQTQQTNNYQKISQ